jgi:DNA ligase-1
MKLFAQLCRELDASGSVEAKLQALERYFRQAPARDAAWALSFLIGRRLPRRGVTSADLRGWVADAAGLPLWLVDKSYEAVGDLAETLALLLPPAPAPQPPPLHVLVEERLLRLSELEPEARRRVVLQTWQELDGWQRFVWHKLMTGGFRLGVARSLTARALARLAGVEPAVIEHRLMGNWRPTAADFERLLRADLRDGDASRPYPFQLAHPLEAVPETLGPCEDWQIEWKWDGIRAQLIHRRGQVLLWSRGEELITDQFPELAEAAAGLPSGSVLDGEVLVWRGQRPAPYADLQKRLGRKRVDARLRRDFPAVFMAYDLLEDSGQDCRAWDLARRRLRLEALCTGSLMSPALLLSPVLPAASWAEAARLRDQARQAGAEGVMLKRRDSRYGVGRVRGAWWKWKVEPLHIDAVLISAQAGHGRRAGLYTDFTFAVWDQDRLVPVAKAYSGLTDEEMSEVDAFVKANTLDRFGPVRVVRPSLVFELAFEGIRPSPRHKSGVALRFPRIHRWRRDKGPQDADHLDQLRKLLATDDLSP